MTRRNAVAGLSPASPVDGPAAVGFAATNDEYATRFPAAPPTRYVARLGLEPPGVLVSIRMTAFPGGRA